MNLFSPLQNYLIVFTEIFHDLPLGERPHLQGPSIAHPRRAAAVGGGLCGVLEAAHPEVLPTALDLEGGVLDGEDGAGATWNSWFKHILCQKK
jgi:hypothetical protein